MEWRCLVQDETIFQKVLESSSRRGHETCGKLSGYGLEALGFRLYRGRAPAMCRYSVQHLWRILYATDKHLDML